MPNTRVTSGMRMTVAQNIRVDSLRVRLTLRFSGSLDWTATRSVSSASQLTVIRRKSPLADVVE